VKAKHQRLTLVAGALVALGGALALGVSTLGEKATYFYAPSDIAAKPPLPDQPIRLGGMVEQGSLTHPEPATVAFRVTDNVREVAVRYTGILPDLFREGQGVIADGKFDGRVFIADIILAKHDEKYMPPQLAGMKPSVGKVE